jgi:hypothetical protein
MGELMFERAEKTEFPSQEQPEACSYEETDEGRLKVGEGEKLSIRHRYDGYPVSDCPQQRYDPDQELHSQ